jgi:thymidine phosphorylase
VKQGDVLMMLHADDVTLFESAFKELDRAVMIGDENRMKFH